MSSEQETDVALVRRYFAAHDAGADALLPLLAPDVVLDVPSSLPYGGMHRGHDGFKAALAGMGRSWADVSSSDFAYAVEQGGQTVTVVSIMRARAVPTGRRVTMPVAETFVIEDGTIKHIRPYYFDTAALLDALAQPRGGNELTGYE